ncbi:CLUMA_CG014373, isoform A [Clunio marinus]|uniref:Neuroendocrine protein 7B2 n=1 Tax=Clunio marinus TaxID=568069 RepID=A0A1J1ILV3_9DIPT|nr:CLUMA_CG014373, isoform A [Clunio marinus]
MASSMKIIFLVTIFFGASFAYNNMKDLSFIPDSLLRDLFADALNKDLIGEQSDEYLDDDSSLPLSNARLAMMARATKDQNERIMDYDSILEHSNPHPSLRDSEYMQHSSLWGHQFMSGGGGEGPHVIKPQVKTDAALPAYCNPPNPCPVGYTEDQGCTTDFENTASFSREYQSSQECMCDSEHMFECPANTVQDQANGQQNFGFLSHQFPQEHKNLVAKKFWVKKSSKPATNPYLQGPKLPIAAKKGFNIN